MRRFVLAAATLLLASAAGAESLRVGVWYPANSDQAAALRSIQVEPFGGDAGDDLTVQVEDVLRGIDLGQGPYFQVIPAATGSGGEALLRGTADTEQRFADYTEEHERCVKDGDGKCTSAKKKFTVKCTRRTVELVVALRLIGQDGTLLWSDSRPETYQDSFCEDAESSPRARKSIGRELAGKVAARLRRDFAPFYANDSIRVDENRKGLNKTEAAVFKQAVRSVKDGDAAAACSAWAGLDQGHAPTVYNLGLCAESTGEDAIAARQYARTLSLDPRHAMARRGLDRIADRTRAHRQLEAHAAE